MSLLPQDIFLIMALSRSAKLLLIIIGATKYVEGSTRLQKYGLLVSKKIGEKTILFDDWQSNSFGGFSKSLARTTAILVDDHYVQQNKIVNEYGKSTFRYRITNKGRNEVQDIIHEEKDLVNEICGIVQYYFGKSLKDVLVDSYTLYPEYTGKSTIKHKVNEKRIRQEFLEEFDIPFEQSEHFSSDITNLLITRTHSEHLFNDEDLREKLAKQIGLSDIPELDDSAYDRLAGMLKKNFQIDKIDSVGIVRTVRGS